MATEIELIVLGIASVLGLITAATSGLASLGVNRLLKTTDGLRTDVTTHGKQIAVMESKLPNGEWRAIKEDIAKVGAGVTAVSVDVATLRGEFSQHILSNAQQLATLGSPCLVHKKKVRPNGSR